ncbi:glycoside hydrolase family 3 protein [Olsenella profusa]|uniref:beta-N-acetylhexosaminidase n=1 Tax=Olsenella profusa TaxID=138595 RepID=A0ABS2F1J9_9ACTN|nr:glycoside hydrolase family 3 N-terminal domain-containing protein [Olsenella profusa]MBM6774830.1 glycoside hydrolase family 3 protein [Olsenella profusa]
MSKKSAWTRREVLLATGASCVSAVLAGCAPDRETSQPASGTETLRDPDAAPGAPDSGDAPQQDVPAADPLEAEVTDRLAAMTLEQKVWQLFVVRPEAVTGVSVQTAAGEATRAALVERPVGGIVYFAANLLDADQTRQMLSNTMSYGREVTGLPLLLAVDEEGGTVSRVGGNPGFGVDNVGDMCDVGATGDAQQAYDVAAHISDYLSYLGFNLDFAPDADIANNPNGEMGLRSFGATADAVCPMVAAQVRGFTDGGMLCCAKHFPGIGGALGDSHDARIYSEKTVDELRAEELRPFEAAIAEDVPMIMVGHLSLPNVTGDDDPASVSSEVVTGILREELGYEGVVITDSMGMGAATSSLPDDRLAVEALLAGVDIVLMPADLDAAYQGVLDAVTSGELSGERVDASVARVLRLKLGRLG